MEARQIAKYQKYTTAQLREKAGRVFRKWIRKRDADRPCISCGSWNVSDGGHYYSAGHHPALEFNEDNVHGQCRRCNFYLSANQVEYRKGLIQRIGPERVYKLDTLADFYKRAGWKHDRFYLIEIIERYKK